ncbi:hypothetical protein psyc5s11_22230 [Clostridium gelidum]|uniref:PD-(D/E)XK nuclease family transposase n=1 Tax=Clostridium gelidum TaxID=704125 RepID=A0ABN6IZL3_9CLOT|nr:hypothetical protein [Clostridium gelidum]BCZ46156.1 hypothetical protein psyc5s11_22230 [Clostridium gelidum]
MSTQIKTLIIRNTIACYQPFTIKEVFHTRLNRVVQYAVFIDNDPFEQELGFDKILLDNYPFELKFEVDYERDNYFLTKLDVIIKKRIKSQEGSLENAQNILKNILDNPVEDPIMQEQDIEAEKRYILERTHRIEFIKAAEEKLKTNYNEFSKFIEEKWLS